MGTIVHKEKFPLQKTHSLSCVRYCPFVLPADVLKKYSLGALGDLCTFRHSAIYKTHTQLSSCAAVYRGMVQILLCSKYGIEWYFTFFYSLFLCVLFGFVWNCFRILYMLLCVEVGGWLIVVSQ